MARTRVDYDAIASLYDSQPYRARSVDPQLRAVVAEGPGALTVLDVACGTGNQLIANRAAWPSILFVGLDRSLGMLEQARKKAPDIAWIAGDAAALPCDAASFDMVCCQFAFHHIDDELGMLRETVRVLRPGGRFTLHNICPQQSTGWLYYEYFPEARVRDYEDFWPPETIIENMKAVGFTAVAAIYEPIDFVEDLPAWLDTVRRRDSCSQLQTISDAAYREGLARLERDIADPGMPRLRKNRLCLVKVRGDAPETRLLGAD